MPGRRSKNRSASVSASGSGSGSAIASKSNAPIIDSNISSSASARANANANENALPEWFQKCKSYKIVEYDTTRFPFRELVADWLEVSTVSTSTPSNKNNNDCDKVSDSDSNSSDGNINSNSNSNSNSDELLLDALHTILPTAVNNSSSREPLVLHPLVRQAYISAKIQPALSSTMRRAKKKGLFASPQYHRFVNAYRLFIREVINPLCHSHSRSHSHKKDEHTPRMYNCKDGNNENKYEERNIAQNEHEDAHVLYQYPPTTRVVFPNGNRTISMHCDKDYPGHHKAEINFWLPVTKAVFGNNSLWIESVPMKGDFQPVQLRYGQFLRFDGHDCRHYTVHNDTDICRVSFDFRIVPSELLHGESGSTKSKSTSKSTSAQKKNMDTSMYTMGDFCTEETNENGYVAYWTISKKNKKVPFLAMILRKLCRTACRPYCHWNYHLIWDCHLIWDWDCPRSRWNELIAMDE